MPTIETGRNHSEGFNIMVSSGIPSNTRLPNDNSWKSKI